MSHQDVSVLVAQAVAAELSLGVEANEFDIPFEPEVTYDTSLELEDQTNQGLHVHVVAGDVVSEMIDRSEMEDVVTCDVAIRKVINKRYSEDEIDPLMALRDAIKRYLCPVDGRDARGLSIYEDAVFMRCVTRATFLPAHMRNLTQYTGIVSLTYRIIQ